MIELAPEHKVGLPVEVPILVGGGVVGVAESVPSAIRDAGVGAIVVGPILRTSRAGNQPPRLAEVNGGFLLDTGLQNRGVRKTIRSSAKVWLGLNCPVIAQVADWDEVALRSVVRKLEQSGAIDGIEYLVNADSTADELKSAVSAIRDYCELPLLVKVPHERCMEVATVAVHAGADALVVCQPPVGTTVRNHVAEYESTRPLDSTEVNRPSIITGATQGPVVLPFVLRRLVEIADAQLEVPLIAYGGFTSPKLIDSAFRLGATAIQLDGTLWVEPSLASNLVKYWRDTVG